jgi:isopenicillin-N N-acyltransferase-like protein
MAKLVTRREFLRGAAGGLGLLAGARLLPAQERPTAPEHTLTVISGKPRERGREYGRKFKEAIHSFLEKEIYGAFTKKLPREAALRYAGLCLREIGAYSPVIADEMEGIAEAAGLRVEEVAMINLHEELGHAKILPGVEKCTALAAGPPDTSDGNTYVGQAWDWMLSVYGLSQMLHWKRPEGPSLLAYAYPGLWAGAGLNSAGVSLCWTWGDGIGFAEPNIGIPSYALLTQMLYQESLKDALSEARRARHAGWFNFALADDKGNLAVVEGTPKQLVVEEVRGHAARASYGSGKTLAADGKPARIHPQGQRMCDLLKASRGKLDEPALKASFADHGSTICKHWDTIDVMLFNNTKREAHVSRGPGCMARWKTFRFEER